MEGYSTSLYRYAAWLCGDRALAKDLVQETFVRAGCSLSSLQCDDAVKPWLFNILKCEYQRQSTRPSVETGQFAPDDIADAVGYDTRAGLFVLRRAVAALAPEYSEALVLQVVGGFSCEDIAAFLGISPGMAATRVFRARRQLRDILSDDRRDGSSKVMA